MKALFNAHCDRCKQFRPQCATVFLPKAGKWAADQSCTKPSVLCGVCRLAMSGRYRFNDKHK